MLHNLVQAAFASSGVVEEGKDVGISGFLFVAHVQR